MAQWFEAESTAFLLYTKAPVGLGPEWAAIDQQLGEFLAYYHLRALPMR